jgi:hypothetical protein
MNTENMFKTNKNIVYFIKESFDKGKKKVVTFLKSLTIGRNDLDKV